MSEYSVSGQVNQTVKPKKVKCVDDGHPQKEARQPEPSLNGNINATYNNSSMGRVENKTTITTSKQFGTVAGIPSFSPMVPSANSSTYATMNVLDRNTSTLAKPGNSNTFLVEKNRAITSKKNENSATVPVDLRQNDNSSSMTTVPKINNRPEMPCWMFIRYLT